MSTSEALAAFVGFDVKLPTGKTVRGQPLPYKKALEYMKRLSAYGASPSDVTCQQELVPMVQEFPTVVKLTPPEPFEELSFGEAVNVIRTFFRLQRGDTELVPPPATSPSAPGA